MGNVIQFPLERVRRPKGISLETLVCVAETLKREQELDRIQKMIYALDVLPLPRYVWPHPAI